MTRPSLPGGRHPGAGLGAVGAALVGRRDPGAMLGAVGAAPLCCGDPGAGLGADFMALVGRRHPGAGLGAGCAALVGRRELGAGLGAFGAARHGRGYLGAMLGTHLARLAFLGVEIESRTEAAGRLAARPRGDRRGGGHFPRPPEATRPRGVEAAGSLLAPAHGPDDVIPVDELQHGADEAGQDIRGDDPGTTISRLWSPPRGTCRTA